MPTLLLEGIRPGKGEGGRWIGLWDSDGRSRAGNVLTQPAAGAFGKVLAPSKGLHNTPNRRSALNDPTKRK